MLDYEVRADPTDDGDPLSAAVTAVEELRTASATFRTTIEQGFHDVGDRVTALEARLNRPGTGTETRTDEAVELQTRAWDRYLRYGRDALSADEVRALSVTGSATAGETTVPEAFLREIIKTLTEISPMRSLARVTNVSGTPVLLPRRTGKPVGQWETEMSDSNESSSAYDQWSIPVFEARVYTDISNRLLEDSAFNMEEEIRTDIAEAFAELEGTAFAKGDGATSPNGIITDPALVSMPAASATAIDPDELIDLYYSLKAGYRKKGTWAMATGTIAAVRKLKYPDGKHLWQDSLAAGQPPTLLGSPVEEMTDLDEAAINTIPILFGDFNRAYRIVQRLSLVVLPDRYTQAAKSIVRFHARMRVGGKLILPEAVIGLKMAAV